MLGYVMMMGERVELTLEDLEEAQRLIEIWETGSTPFFRDHSGQDEVVDMGLTMQVVAYEKLTGEVPESEDLRKEES